MFVELAEWKMDGYWPRIVVSDRQITKFEVIPRTL